MPQGVCRCKKLENHCARTLVFVMIKSRCLHCKDSSINHNGHRLNFTARLTRYKRVYGLSGALKIEVSPSGYVNSSHTEMSLRDKKLKILFKPGHLELVQVKLLINF